MTGEWTLAHLLATTYEWGLLTAFRSDIAPEEVFLANRLFRASFAGQRCRAVCVMGDVVAADEGSSEGGEIAVLVLDGHGRMRRTLQAVADGHEIGSFLWQSSKLHAPLALVCGGEAQPIAGGPFSTTAEMMGTLAQVEPRFAVLRARGLQWGSTFPSSRPVEWAA